MRMKKQVDGTLSCMARYTTRACVYQEKLGGGGDHTILVNGMYIIYLKDWLQVFPKEQFRIVRFEEYISNRERYIDDISLFLGLDVVPDEVRDYIRSMPAANTGVSIGGMFDETREMLQDFFRPYNTQLAETLGDEGFKWGY